jgi:hypothetical protein
MNSLQFWTWGKDSDASNWFALIVSLIAWPLILYWYFNHKKQGIPHLNVSFSQGRTNVGGQEFPSLDITFTNQTGRVVYLSLGRLKGRRRLRIPLPPTASAWYELKFAWEKTVSDGALAPLIDFECILQTGKTAATSVAALGVDHAFHSYRPRWFRKWLWWPKYFRMQYTAMVGDKRYSVETIY